MPRAKAPALSVRALACLGSALCAVPAAAAPPMGSVPAVASPTRLSWSSILLSPGRSTGPGDPVCRFLRDLDRAIAAGQLHLMESQGPEGSWPNRERGGAQSPEAETAATAQALLALRDFPQGAQAYSRGRGFMSRSVMTGSQPTAPVNQEPWALSYTLSFLLREHAANPTEELRSQISALLERAAGSSWRYFNMSGRARMNSVQMALLAQGFAQARELGFELPRAPSRETYMPQLQGEAAERLASYPEGGDRDSLEFMHDFLSGARLPHGGFSYYEFVPRQAVPVEETAARSVLIEGLLQRAGRSRDKDVERAMDRFFAHHPGLRGLVDTPQTDSYHHDYANFQGRARYYYLMGIQWASEALAGASDPRSLGRAIDLAATLIDQQRRDGSWMDAAISGPAFGTATAVLSLQSLRGAIRSAAQDPANRLFALCE